MHNQDVAVRLHVAVTAGDSSIKVSLLVSKLHVVSRVVLDVVTEEVGSGSSEVSHIVI